MRRLLLAVVLTSSVMVPTGAADTVDATWSEREARFTLIAFEAAYSCDMVEARIAMLLRHLGATDIDVRASPCPGFNRPQRRIPITARFSALTLDGDGDVEIVEAAWSEVVLGRRSPRFTDGRDCQILEHFIKHLLPAFEHEVVEGRAGCGAVRHSIVGRLRLKILGPAEAGP